MPLVHFYKSSLPNIIISYTREAMTVLSTPAYRNLANRLIFCKCTSKPHKLRNTVAPFKLCNMQAVIKFVVKKGIKIL